MQSNAKQNFNNANVAVIIAKNKFINKEKVAFWKFLMYATKAEIHLNELQSLLFWVGIMECLLFLVAFALFISHPSTFAILWAFITHVLRAVLGFILLARLPNSFQVIEEIKGYENNSMEEIETQILTLFKNLLSNNQSRIKPIAITYFVFTIIDIIVDNVVFFFLLGKWTQIEYDFQNIVVLVMIVAFFLCNGVYFSLFSSVQMHFPKEMRRGVNFVILGDLSRLKEVMMMDAKGALSSIKNKLGWHGQEREGEGEESKSPGVKYEQNPKVEAMMIE